MSPKELKRLKDLWEKGNSVPHGGMKVEWKKEKPKLYCTIVVVAINRFRFVLWMN